MLDFDRLWDYNQPEATEARFRALLADPAMTDPNHRGQLLTQIGRTLSLQGRFTEAHAVLDQVEAMLTPALPVVRIRYLLERGRTYNSAGGPQRALPLFREAWDLARQVGEDFHAVDAAHMVAIAEPAPEEQLAWNLRAVKLAEKSETARRWLGSLSNNIGWIHADAGRYDEALTAFDRALAFRLEQGNPGPIRIARWCVAKMYRMLGRTAEALAVQEALRKEAEARPHFARAYALLSGLRWLAESEPQRLERLCTLGTGS